MLTLGLIARIWESEAYTHSESAVLTVALLKADALGLVRHPVRYLAAKTRLAPNTVIGALDALVRIGVLAVVEPPGKQTPATYRVNYTRIAQAGLSDDTVRAGQRASPQRHEAHRYQLSEEEVRYTLDNYRRRLADVEALLADPRTGADKERLLALIRERDSLELDLIPKMERAMILYHPPAPLTV